MKKGILIFIFTLIFIVTLFPLLSAKSLALTLSQENLDKIKELKEKVASKVSELRQKKKMFYSGEVKSVKEDSFILLTSDGEKTIQTDKNTKYLWINTNGKKMVISFKNIEAGDSFSVLGEGIEGDFITAIMAIGKVNTFSLEGKVSEKTLGGKKFNIILDAKNNFLPVSLTDNADIYSVDGNVLKEGKFADINGGAKILVRGSYKDKTKSEISGKRVVILEGSSLIPTVTKPPAKS